MDMKVRLSTLWIVITFNILIADILSIIVELVNKNTLDIIGEVTTTMAIAAVLLNIPIFMVFLSRSLHYNANRKLNIIACIITILFVIGGGSLVLHYVICASIEVVLLISIITSAWQWKDNETNKPIQ